MSDTVIELNHWINPIKRIRILYKARVKVFSFKLTIICSLILNQAKYIYYNSHIISTVLSHLNQNKILSAYYSRSLSSVGVVLVVLSVLLSVWLSVRGRMPLAGRRVSWSILRRSEPADHVPQHSVAHRVGALHGSCSLETRVRPVTSSFIITPVLWFECLFRHGNVRK